MEKIKNMLILFFWDLVKDDDESDYDSSGPAEDASPDISAGNASPGIEAGSLPPSASEEDQHTRVRGKEPPPRPRRSTGQPAQKEDSGGGDSVADASDTPAYSYSSTR